MTKTADQREKDLKEGVTSSVASAWSDAASKFQKDLNAPIFLKNGNVAALVARYDKLQEEFDKSRVKKKLSVDVFEAADSQIEKFSTEGEGLLKELTDIANDESASYTVKDADDPQAVITNWENALKAGQGTNKAQKAVFARWEKLGASVEKIAADAIAKAKKEVASAQAVLNSTNSQLNATEGEIRKVIGLYQNVATDMNRQDIASAVRGFLAIFAKA
jgi:hypothetical protein